MNRSPLIRYILCSCKVLVKLKNKTLKTKFWLLCICTCCYTIAREQSNQGLQCLLSGQTFRFMVGPDHCPIFQNMTTHFPRQWAQWIHPFFVNKSHFNKKYSSYSESTDSTKQKVHVGCQYSKTCPKQPLKDKTKILKTNGSLMKVKRIAECSSILQYL